MEEKEQQIIITQFESGRSIWNSFPHYILHRFRSSSRSVTLLFERENFEKKTGSLLLDRLMFRIYFHGCGQLTLALPLTNRNYDKTDLVKEKEEQIIILKVAGLYGTSPHNLFYIDLDLALNQPHYHLKL